MEILRGSSVLRSTQWLCRRVSTRWEQWAAFPSLLSVLRYLSWNELSVMYFSYDMSSQYQPAVLSDTPYRRTIRSKLQEKPAELACWFPMLSFKRKFTDPIISAQVLLSPFNYLWSPGLRCHRTATTESGKRDLLCVGTRVWVRVRARVAMTRCHFGQKQNSPSVIQLDILPLSFAFGS